MKLLELLRHTNPLCSPRWTAAGRGFGDFVFWLPPRARVVLEGREHLPAGPAIFAPNHTHKFDFFPVRCALLDLGVHLMTWIKARDYQHPVMRWMLGKGGNIPLVSRGFLIASDFVEVHGRKPTENEYRALRLHVDEGTALDAPMAARLAAPRRIAGVEVDLARGYRLAVRHAYRVLMEEALRLARLGRDAGRHQHIYPQGATSRQLTPGHPGVVQAALALGIPIIPLGVSGCREIFVGKGHPFTRGGRVTVRVGPPFEVSRTLVPEGFRPFHPDDEEAHRLVLQAETDRLMEVINGLCEPAYRWADDVHSDARRGVARFYF